MDSDNLESILVIPDQKNFASIVSSCPCYQRGRISHLIGTANYFLNQEQEAIIHFKNAVFKYWKECKEVSLDEIANSIYNIGVSYQYTEQLLKGKSYIDSAFLIIEDLDSFPKGDLAYKYQGAGSYFNTIGDFERANAYFNNALALSHHIDEVDVFYTHIDLLTLLLQFNKNDQANELIKSINQKFINQKNILQDLDLAIYNLNCAEAFLRKENYIIADSVCNQAIELLSPSDVDLLSNVYEILGAIHYKQNKYEKSKQYYNQAYELRLQEENIVSAKIAQSFSLENLAELDLVNKNFAEALTKVNQAIGILTLAFPKDKLENPVLKSFQVDNALHLIRQLMLKERIFYKKYENTKDVQILTYCAELHFKVDTLLDNVLANAFLDQSKLELLDIISNYSSKAVDVCLELFKVTGNRSDLDNAFYFSSRSKAAVLQKLINNNDFLTNNSNDQVLAEYMRLKDELNNVQKAIHESSDSNDSLMNRFTSIQLKFDKFYNQEIFIIGREDMNIHERMPTQVFQSKLQPDEVMIDFFQGVNLTTFFILSQKDFRYFQLENDLIISQVNEVKKQCTNTSTKYDKHLAHELFLNLFEWISAPQFEELKSLYIIPDGVFHGLAFEALIDGKGRFLVEKYDITYAYEASMVFANNKNSAHQHFFSGWSTSYSGILSERLREKGFSNEQSSLGNLDLAKKELQTCNDVFDGNAFYDIDASISNFRRYASDSKIVYLSMHGIVDRENGSKSSLIFDDRNDDFIFRAYELYQEPLNSDLVVLSACNSADGKYHSGEGINGISRAFLASGAESLVSSMWAASEVSSIKILPAFLMKYKSGMNNSVALQNAKKDYLARAIPSQQHPFYWANYILISSIDSQETSTSNWFIFLALALFGIIGAFLLLKYRKTA